MVFRARLAAVLLCSAAFAATGHALAQPEEGSVEVVEVSGIIDASVEKAIDGTIERAEREDASLVLLQIDSRGVVDGARTERLMRRVRDAEVPVATWIGPPGSQAANGAALLADAAEIRAMAPGSFIGPVRTADLRQAETETEPTAFDEGLSATAAREEDVVEMVEPSIQDVLETIDDRDLTFEGDPISIDADEATIRFNELDLLGRMLHGAAQPSIAYLLLLAGLIGVVFELFHPSTGPAGVSGLFALALSGYGIATLGGSWLAVALIVASVVAFAVDLRFESLGLFTAGATIALIAGSLLLFRSPWLQVSPWILAFGIISMFVFMVSVMTRVLRDLRLVARGELEVTEAHPHPEEDPH